jgi:hypothetical protein
VLHFSSKTTSKRVVPVNFDPTPPPDHVGSKKHAVFVMQGFIRKRHQRRGCMNRIRNG